MNAPRPLTFTYAEGFLETPDAEQADALKLAELVLEWWKTQVVIGKRELEMYQLAYKIQAAFNQPILERTNHEG